jgi:SAM-dependent methyltransferase
MDPMTANSPANIDSHTVAGFGDEWDAFDQTELDPAEHRRLFDAYFSVFPFDQLPADAEGFDLGCGSGRWAALMAERVGTLHCIDPAAKALEVTRRRLRDRPNVRFHLATSETMPLAPGSMDFGYSLGVLHHIPDTAGALRDCVQRLKSGAPMLVYLYYRFDNRPAWFRAVWRASESGRRVISRLPFRLRKWAAEAIALGVYWPLARGAGALEKLGANVSALPLSSYRDCSFYTMRTDALDRFGTRLEQRFTRAEITAMMEEAGLRDIRFRESEPFWVACGTKA